MAKVLVPLANGFEELEAIAVIDVLRRGGVEVVTASIHESQDVKGAHGVPVRADALLADGRQDSEGRLLCAICAAPTVLVEAEALAPGLHVTCYPTCQMQLDRQWTPAPVVVDGNVITGQAPGTALLFALVVLQTLAGDKVAQKVARAMVTNVLG